jgi:hypothetical protein
MQGNRVIKGWLNVGVATLVLVAGELGAAEVYRSTGPDGEVQFSDVETPGAEAVTVDTPEPASGDADAWVAETLEVALALQEARLEREAAAAERRAALRERTAPMPLPPQAPAERTTYAPWYPYPWPPHGHHRPDRPGHRPPGRPERPPTVDPEPPSMEAPIPGAGWAERN